VALIVRNSCAAIIKNQKENFGFSDAGDFLPSPSLNAQCQESSHDA
jgi:hypothetical protein